MLVILYTNSYRCSDSTWELVKSELHKGGVVTMLDDATSSRSSLDNLAT